MGAPSAGTLSRRQACGGRPRGLVALKSQIAVLSENRGWVRCMSNALGCLAFKAGVCKGLSMWLVCPMPLHRMAMVADTPWLGKDRPRGLAPSEDEIWRPGSHELTLMRKFFTWLHTRITRKLLQCKNASASPQTDDTVGSKGMGGASTFFKGSGVQPRWRTAAPASLSCPSGHIGIGVRRTLRYRYLQICSVCPLP